MPNEHETEVSFNIYTLLFLKQLRTYFYIQKHPYSYYTT